MRSAVGLAQVAVWIHLLLVAGLGVGCAGAPRAAPVVIPAAELAGTEDDPEADPRETPPGGTWWSREAPCPDGARVVTKHDEAGRGARCELSDGTAHGMLTRWSPEGKLVQHGRFERGLRVGEWSDYSPPGQLSRRAEHAEGKLHGRFREWQGSTLTLDCQYQRGARQGVCAEFYPDGAPRSRTNYTSGVPDGEHISWQPNGALSQRGDYLHGAEHGEWELCSEDGSCSAGRYEQGGRAGIWVTKDAASVTVQTEDYSVPDQLTRIDYCEGRPCKRTVYVRQ